MLGESLCTHAQAPQLNPILSQSSLSSLLSCLKCSVLWSLTSLRTKGPPSTLSETQYAQMRTPLRQVWLKNGFESLSAHQAPTKRPLGARPQKSAKAPPAPPLPPYVHMGA